MKTIFIPVRSKSVVDESRVLEISKNIPKEIAVLFSVQYINQAKKIKSLLEKKHKITKFSQVLGCSKPNLPKETKAILLISDGKFHGISLAFETKLPVYIFSNNKLEKISKEEIEKLEKKQKVSLVKFLNSSNVGILVSTKPGQENLKKAIELKKKLKKKNSFLFITNNINKQEFENFSQIDSWVNTACPRMDMNDGEIVNINDVN